MARELRSRLVRHAQRSGVELSVREAARLEAYFGLLTKWNRKINLTSLPLEPLGDETLDRLMMEPLVASKLVSSSDRCLLDIGSGGGSPAVPLIVSSSSIVKAVLVEVKVRKAAFLREVVRELGLEGVEVENRRFEELLSRTDLHESIDVVTLRAVRADANVWKTIRAFVGQGGRVFWFGAPEGAAKSLDSVVSSVTMHALGRSSSRLAVAQFGRF